MLRAIFFDAGNTLVFPNLERTLAPLQQRGLRPTAEQLHAAERAAKHKLDAGELRTESNSVDYNYWHTYYSQLLDSMSLRENDLLAALIQSSRTSGSWDRVLPGTRDVLDELRAKYRLAVISNSDGGISDLLHHCGIGDCFECITDSRHAGSEKPDLKIFQAALTQVGVAPGESVYVGDVYSVDYLGARAAGMNAILFDVSGAYVNQPFPRVASLQDLAVQVGQMSSLG